jgi:1-deoxy-D-xylulose-5-phosphate reductoisomerase
VAVLGSTGSIGVQALDLIDRFPERFQVVALSAGCNAGQLARQVLKHRPRLVAIGDERRKGELEAAARDSGSRLLVGTEGLLEVAACADADVVLAAIVGSAGLLPTYHALKAGKVVALANKESLVMAGPLMLQAAGESGGSLIPVDSEHSALHQCLRGESIESVHRLILTASGGPFRTTPLEGLASVTAAQALKHPVWEMGKKISVDSATLMNKGLEVIEAHWLFGLPGDRIDVILHPQSSVHSMVEMVDGSVICQMGVPDMRGPIQYALGYPDRFAGPVGPLDLSQARSLEFYPVDRQRFPSLDLAYGALEAGGTSPAVLNAANEVAVQTFLAGGMDFLSIPAVVREVLDGHQPRPVHSIEEILDADRSAREEAERIVMKAGRT